MGLASLAERFFSRRLPRLTAGELKSARPLQNPVVESHVQEDGSVVLECPLSMQGKGVMAALARKAKMPDVRRFELEPVGAFVWSLCDGKTSFEGISRKLREKYKMNRLEADAALTAFLETLSRRRLIVLMVKKEK
jgi:hypothetical protein